MNYINKIRIFADMRSFDSPVDENTRKMPKMRANDDVSIDVVFYNNGTLVDTTSLKKVVLEIIDIGGFNAPSPRTETIILRREIDENSIGIGIDEAAVAQGESHATFELSDGASNLPDGEKWFRIYSLDASAKRTTFASGWIDIEKSFGDEMPSNAEISPTQYLTADTASGIFLKKTNNLNDIQDAALARESLDAPSKTEVQTDITNAILSHSHTDYASVSEVNAVALSADTNTAAIENISQKYVEKGFCIFDGGILESPVTAGWTGAHFPLSICLTYDVAQWQSNAFNFFNTKIYPGTGISLEYNPSDCNLRLSFMGVADSDSRTYLHVGVVYKTSKITTAGLPTGKHTIVVNFFNARHLGETKATVVPAGDGGAGVLDTEIWIDGEKLSSPTYVDSGRTNYSFCKTTNWGGSGNLQFGGSGAYLDGQLTTNNFKGVLSRIKMFNFALSTTSPYTIVDYTKYRDESPVFLQNQEGSKSILRLSDSADITQIRDLSAARNHATITGKVLPSKTSNAQQTSGVQTWVTSVGAYMLSSAEILPPNAEVEFIATSNTPATFQLGTSTGSPNVYGSFSATSTISKTAFYTGDSTTKLYITPSVAAVTLQYSMKITQLK